MQYPKLPILQAWNIPHSHETQPVKAMHIIMNLVGGVLETIYTDLPTLNHSKAALIPTNMASVIVISVVSKLVKFNISNPMDPECSQTKLNI